MGPIKSCPGLSKAPHAGRTYGAPSAYQKLLRRKEDLIVQVLDSETEDIHSRHMLFAWC